MFDYLVRFCEEGRDKDVFVLICLYTRQKNEVKKIIPSSLEILSYPLAFMSKKFLFKLQKDTSN